ncbi:EthD domain-containing protein [Phenylobacterium sp. LjRoot225]|uniref:EthD domain-containing protein n=1 Tax=Phenylobacterium sp. LjRoot225 TaxID=3342285 RepID=UPI003ED0A91D
MYKVLWFLKRKAGITFEQFQDHYETSHSVLGQKYFGHRLLEYKRNYKVETWGGGVTGEDGGHGFGPKPWDYDCVTEWVMPDEAAYDEIIRLLADPVISKVFYEDEEHFLDRDATLLIKCDARDTGPGDGAETLRLQRA